MGCGKTTVGKSLAKLESAIFLDTDERIEEKQGRSISEIFASDSEKAFRDMETAYLKDLIKKRRYDRFYRRRYAGAYGES